MRSCYNSRGGVLKYFLVVGHFLFKTFMQSNYFLDASITEVGRF